MKYLTKNYEVKGNKKAFKIMQNCFPFLLSHLNANLSHYKKETNTLVKDDYTHFFTVDAKNRFCHAQFRMYANIKTLQKIGKFGMNKNVQKSYEVAVETFTPYGNSDCVMIRDNRHYEKFSDGFLLLGDAFFADKFDWYNDPAYYKTVTKVWKARDIPVTIRKKDGTTAERIWHIKAHRCIYRNYNLRKLYEDGKIHTYGWLSHYYTDDFGNVHVDDRLNDESATLDYNFVDLHEYVEDEENLSKIKCIQYDEMDRRSESVVYCTFGPTKEQMFGKQLDKRFTIKEIWKTLYLLGTPTTTEEKFRSLVLKKLRSKTVRASEFTYSDRSSIWFAVCENKDCFVAKNATAAERKRLQRLRQKKNNIIAENLIEEKDASGGIS